MHIRRDEYLNTLIDPFPLARPEREAEGVSEEGER